METEGQDTSHLCVVCQAPAHDFITLSGTAYGDPRLEPPGIRKDRRSLWEDKGPERTFEVRIPLCADCNNLRLSIDALRTQAQQLPWWIPAVALCTGTPVAAWFVRVGYQTEQITVGYAVAAISGVSTVALIVALLGKLNAILRKKIHLDLAEAERIIAVLKHTSKELLKREKAKVSAQLKREQQARLTDLENLQRLGGHRFEELVTRLFAKMGYSAYKTKGSADGGVDIVAEREGETFLIQCKNYKHPIGPSAVRDLFGVMSSEKAKKGILVCTSTFSESARAFAKKTRIELVDGEGVVEMIRKYNITS